MDNDTNISNELGDSPRSERGSDLKSKPGIIDASKQFGLKTLSSLLSRLNLANRAGLQFGGERDLYEIFGYNLAPKPEDFLAKYKRQDIASRIVDAPPDATWFNTPIIKDNEPLTTQWNELAKSAKLWGAMHRADKLARLNHFSLLLFGFDDGGNLKRKAGNVKKLLYVKPIGSRQVTEITFDTNTRSPRFGLPETYKIKFDDPAKKSILGGSINVAGVKDLIVHWTRVVHVAEHLLEDEVFGNPAMERVYNLLDDLLKVTGGTSEMFWLSGRGGLQADIDKEMEIEPADAAALTDEMDEFMHQLRRVIRTRGVTLTPLDHAVPNPREIFVILVSLISGTTGIPRRILLGSEAGQLASEQDRANWAERIEERRVLYANPSILDPTYALMQRVGLMPEGEVVWVWPSAFIQNPLEKGQTMAQTARAIGNISRQTGASTPMPLINTEEARGVIGFEGDLDMSKIQMVEPPEPKEPTGGGDGEEGETREDKEKRIKEEKEDE